MIIDNLDVFIWNRWRRSVAKGDDLRIAMRILKGFKERGVIKKVNSILAQDIPIVVLKVGRFYFHFEIYKGEIL